MPTEPDSPRGGEGAGEPVTPPSAPGMDTEEGRRRTVLEAMGSFALEGMQPSADTIAWARDYIEGRLTSAQILQRLKRRYGVDDR